MINRETVSERAAAFVEDFNFLAEWPDKYNYLLELGYCLPELPEALKIEAYRVPGCVSKTYFIVENDGERIHVQGNSNSPTMAGVVAVFIELYNNAPTTEVAADGGAWIEKTNILNNVVATRSATISKMRARLLAAANEKH